MKTKDIPLNTCVSYKKHGYSYSGDRAWVLSHDRYRYGSSGYSFRRGPIEKSEGHYKREGGLLIVVADRHNLTRKQIELLNSVTAEMVMAHGGDLPPEIFGKLDFVVRVEIVPSATIEGLWEDVEAERKEQEAQRETYAQQAEERRQDRVRRMTQVVEALNSIMGPDRYQVASYEDASGLKVRLEDLELLVDTLRSKGVV